jgi:hypothetical protein
MLFPIPGLDRDNPTRGGPNGSAETKFDFGLRGRLGSS